MSFQLQKGRSFNISPPATAYELNSRLKRPKASGGDGLRTLDTIDQQHPTPLENSYVGGEAGLVYELIHSGFRERTKPDLAKGCVGQDQRLQTV